MYTIIYALSHTQIDDLMRLFAPEFWAGNRERTGVERMLQNSDVVVAAVDRAGRVVGFARVLTDFVYRATLFDVIVDEQVRSRGVGRLVLDAILNHPRLREVESIDLSCKPDKIDLYRKWGFTTDLGGTFFMRRRRDSASAAVS